MHGCIGRWTHASRYPDTVEGEQKTRIVGNVRNVKDPARCWFTYALQTLNPFVCSEQCVESLSVWLACVLWILRVVARSIRRSELLFSIHLLIIRSWTGGVGLVHPCGNKASSSQCILLAAQQTTPTEISGAHIVACLNMQCIIGVDHRQRSVLQILCCGHYRSKTILVCFAMMWRVSTILRGILREPEHDKHATATMQ